MIRSRPVLFGIAILMIGVLAASVACTQESEPSPTTQVTDSPEAIPTLEPTDRSEPPPTIQPTVTPTSAPAIQPTHTPEAAPTPEASPTPIAKPTTPLVDTQTMETPPECAGIDPTNTPDPNRPEGIRGREYQFWNVSSFEEAECITDYPIAVPTNLPEGFIRGENIIVHKRSTSHFEDRWVEHGWGIPGDPAYGFRLSQHSWKFSLGDGEPTMINGIPGERRLRPAMPPDFPPLLTLLWEEDGYWYTVMGFLGGPITEEFLLEVAASLELRDAVAGTPPTTAVSQDCSALTPTSTPDPDRPEGIRGMSSDFWNVSSFQEAECYTGYPIAVPTHLPEDFIRSETIIVYKMGTSDWEDIFVEHGWYVPIDPAIGVRLSQHTRRFSLGGGEPAVINGLPGERLLDPARPPDFPQGLTLLWKQGGYWYTVFGFLHGPITEEFLLKVAASLELRDGV